MEALLKMKKIEIKGFWRRRRGRVRIGQSNA
jgi:hypothetical protein